MPYTHVVLLGHIVLVTDDYVVLSVGFNQTEQARIPIYDVGIGLKRCQESLGCLALLIGHIGFNDHNVGSFISCDSLEICDNSYYERHKKAIDEIVSTKFNKSNSDNIATCCATHLIDSFYKRVN